MSDLISRQAAIDALSTPHGILYPIRTIENLPSAEPEQRWIPCSETEDLPKHEVLCCDKNGEELIGWLLYEDDRWLCESDGVMIYDPIAWREKPEPWRGE